MKDSARGFKIEEKKSWLGYSNGSRRMAETILFQSWSFALKSFDSTFRKSCNVEQLAQVWDLPCLLLSQDTKIEMLGTRVFLG